MASHFNLTEDIYKARSKRKRAFSYEHFNQTDISAPDDVDQLHPEVENPLFGETRKTNSIKPFLKSQHHEVLHTILMRCLLEGDFERADRAFAMILRSGQDIDLRKNGLWGIGAELTLRRPKVHSTQDDGDDQGSQVGVDVHKETAFEKGIFNEESFKAVKTYYERLCLQYEYSKKRPNVISAVHFYPAMIGLWIAQVDARFKATQVGQAEKIRQPYSEALSDIDINDGVGIDEHFSMKTERANGSTPESDSQMHRDHPISQAEYISDYLDDLLTRSPFDTNQELLLLSVDIALWNADLHLTQGMSNTTVDKWKRRAEELSRRLESLNLDEDNSE